MTLGPVLNAKKLHDGEVKDAGLATHWLSPSSTPLQLPAVVRGCFERAPGAENELNSIQFITFFDDFHVPAFILPPTQSPSKASFRQKKTRVNVGGPNQPSHPVP